MIKLFTSQMIGAPELRRAPTSLIDFLTVLLVNGFNNSAPDSVSYADGVVTVFYTGGHAYENGNILLVEGADQSEYNGEFKIFGCTVNVFKYNISGTPVSPATGSLVTRVASAGWTKTIQEGSKAVFRSSGGRQFYLYVDENTCSELSTGTSSDYDYPGNENNTAKLYIAESVIDLDTYTGRTKPVYVEKVYQKFTSDLASKWFFVATDRGFVFGIGFADQTGKGYRHFYFGEYNPNDANNIYNGFIAGSYGGTSSYLWYYDGRYMDRDTSTHTYAIEQSVVENEVSGIYSLRDYTGAKFSPSLRFTRALVNSTPGIFGTGGASMPFYSNINGAIMFNKILLSEYNTISGRIPGVYCPIQKSAEPLTDSMLPILGVDIDGISRDFLQVGTAGNVGAIMIDLTGPWYD